MYYYIKYMRDIYEQVNKIPTTSTGQVRRELFNITLKDYKDFWGKWSFIDIVSRDIINEITYSTIF